MDFATAPAITAALQARLTDGAYGYEAPSAAYFTTVAEWLATQHQARPALDWLMFAGGVMPALAALIRQLTAPGDQILVQAPVYNMFFSTIAANGRRAVSADLRYTAGQYAIDWPALAAQLAAPATTMMLLCSPHNPIGRVWSRSELTRIAALCAQCEVQLVADEIHADLVWRGAPHVPLHAVTDTGISLISPSKTFNLAGLHSATVIVPEPTRRAQVRRALAIAQVDEPTVLAVPGTIAAYSQGGLWLAALNQQLRTNWTEVIAFLAANLPRCTWFRPPRLT
ncbi:MalY/PatB family protein [Lacticaseibacillus absianus]|uniref:MalY/PatB family protein n=1 Tax=Lacticaseibacillus absianus TaxID=2729623 RepID=UPI001FE4E352|nr:aminotransferase class I/II-fold pyridoxal phosphate-dependent enzyme [Lacticaseibacillus absianus]